MPRRNKNKGDFCSLRYLAIYENDNILAEISSKNCLDAMSGNEFNEKNVTAMQRSQYLAGVVTQKIHTDNKAGVHVIQQHLHQFINNFQSLSAKCKAIANTS